MGHSLNSEAVNEEVLSSRTGLQEFKVVEFLLIQQKFGRPNKVLRLNMGQWKFLLIQQNIFLGAEVILSIKNSSKDFL